MKYKVEISASKEVIIEADNYDEAYDNANELPLELNDFDWNFNVEVDE